MLEDGDASAGDGTNFCQASFLDWVGVISLFNDFKSGLGDINDNWLKVNKNAYEN